MIPTPDGQASGLRRRLWERILTGAVTTAVLVVVAWVAAVNWDEYRALVESLSLLPLVGAFGAALTGQFLNVMISHISLQVEGVPLSLASTYRLIVVGGLAKYIPGGIWQIGSQAALGRAAGLDFKHSMLAWIEPTAFNISVGAGLALLAATQVEYGISGLILIPVALVALMASINFFRYEVYRLVRLIPRDRAVPQPWTGWPRQFLIAVVIIALTGAGGLLVVSAFDLETQISYLGSVAAFVGAWVIGFLAFPIPGGIGVREGALLLTLAPWMPAHHALLVSAASRLVAIAAELTSGVVGVAIGWTGYRVADTPVPYEERR